MSPIGKKLEVLSLARKSPAEMEAERLKLGGFTDIPEQGYARYAMEAMRLGFSPNVTPRRLAWAWFRRMTRTKWTVFGYDEFARAHHRSWGGLPVRIAADVARIREIAPDIKLLVNAKFDDPVLVTENGLILRAWIADYIYF